MNTRYFSVFILSCSSVLFSNVSAAQSARTVTVEGEPYQTFERDGVHQVVAKTHLGTIRPIAPTFEDRCSSVFADLERFRFLMERCSSSEAPEAACRNLANAVMPTLWGISVPQERIPAGIHQEWSVGFRSKNLPAPHFHKKAAEILNARDSDISLLRLKSADLSQAKIQLDSAKNSLLAMLRQNPYNTKPIGQIAITTSGNIQTQDLLTACSIAKTEAKLRITTTGSFSQEYASPFGRSEFWNLFTFLKSKFDPSQRSPHASAILAGYYTAEFIGETGTKIPTQAAILATLSAFETSIHTDELAFKNYASLADIPEDWQLDQRTVKQKTTITLDIAGASRE